MNNLNISLLSSKAQKGPRELRQDELQQLHDALLVEIKKHGYENIADFINIDLLSKNPEQEAFDAQLQLQEECKDWALSVDEFENTIFIESANRHEVVESMEQLLKKRRTLGIFQRMGKMVRILKECSKNQSKTGQEIRIDELDKHALMLAFDEIAFFEVYKADSGVIKRVNTNEKHVSLLLSKKQWDLPVLKGIIHAPTFRADGSPLDEEGYDEKSEQWTKDKWWAAGFTAWSKRVRGAVIWLGMEDPCLSCKAVEAEDPVTITLRNLLVTWHKIFGSTAITIKRLTDEANTTPQTASADEIATRESLKDALLELSGSNQEKINLRALGKKLSTLKKRICSGYRLEQFGEQQGSALWRVVVVKENGK
jgi:hypothetical protein